MRIIIINLDSAPERLHFQKWQMSHFGLEFERLKAVSVDELPRSLSERYWSTWERPLRLSERAALLSHRQAWSRVLRSGRPALILEDDAVLSAKLPGHLPELSSVPDAEHITLEVRGRRKLVSRNCIHASGGLALRRIYQDRSGAAAYVLTPNGAAKLLSSTENRSGLTDAIIRSAYKLVSYQCEPACAVQIDQCFSYGLSTPVETRSAIGESPKTRTISLQIPTTSGVGYRARRLAAQVRMGVRMLSCYAVSEYRLVALDSSDFQHLDLFTHK